MKVMFAPNISMEEINGKNQSIAPTFG